MSQVEQAGWGVPTSNRDQLLTDWKKTKDELDALAIKEKELRAQVIEAFSEITDEDHSGVENVDIGFGHTLKIEHKISYKLDDARVDAALEEIEKTIEHGELLAERVVTFKPSFSVSEYKKLPDAAKKIMDRVLTIKPASKSIKIAKDKA